MILRAQSCHLCTGGPGKYPKRMCTGRKLVSGVRDSFSDAPRTPSQSLQTVRQRNGSTLGTGVWKGPLTGTVNSMTQAQCLIVRGATVPHLRTDRPQSYRTGYPSDLGCSLQYLPPKSEKIGSRAWDLLSQQRGTSLGCGDCSPELQRTEPPLAPAV